MKMVDAHIQIIVKFQTMESALNTKIILYVKWGKYIFSKDLFYVNQLTQKILKIVKK